MSLDLLGSPTFTDLTGSTINPDVAQTPGPFPDWTFVPGQWTPMGSTPFEFAPSMELSDLDLRFLDSYNVNVPFELEDSSPKLSQPEADTCRAAAVASDAFHNCHWRFRPNATDHGAAEEHNLSLPADHAPGLRLNFRATGTKLSVSSRDKILTTVVESCKPENVSRAMASFPSLDLLDSLLQYSLTSPISRFDSFLHAATFDPNEKRPELLAAMAARGAVLTADPALTKLGHAIQEILRSAIPKHVRLPLFFFFHPLPPPSGRKCPAIFTIANKPPVGTQQQLDPRPRTSSILPHNPRNRPLERQRPQGRNSRVLPPARPNHDAPLRQVPLVKLPQDYRARRRGRRGAGAHVAGLGPPGELQEACVEDREARRGFVGCAAG